MQAATLLDFKPSVATLARHEGVWDGVYRYYDASGVQVDQHRSRLFCRFPPGKPGTYHQTNHYTWDDGRTETRDFPALIRDGRLVWQGKILRPGEGRAVNRFFGVPSVPGRLYQGSSWVDGRPALILDYAGTSWVYRNNRDEIRQVAPGVYLGLMFDRTTVPPRRTMIFALETSR